MSIVDIVQELPPELQPTMFKLVEAIDRDIREKYAVRREDFDALRATVQELAEAQRRTEQRLDELVEAQRRTEQRVDELAEAQRRTEQRVDRLEEALITLTKRVDQLTERVDQLTVRMDQLTERVERLEEALITLTKRVDQLTERVDQLTERMDQLTERVERLEEALITLTKRVDQLTERMDQLTERVDRLAATMERFQVVQAKNTGWRLEQTYRERAYAYFGRVLRKVRVVSIEEIEDEIEELPAPDRDELLLLDLIVRGRPRDVTDSTQVYLAVEVSAVVDRNDVERAWRRARILRSLGYVVVPVVAGEDVTRGGEESARENRVALFQNGTHQFWPEALEMALSQPRR